MSSSEQEPMPIREPETTEGGASGPPSSDEVLGDDAQAAEAVPPSEDGGAQTSGETIGATSETTQESDNPALERDPSEWVSGGDPITEAQKSYLDTLAKQAGEELPADLTKAQASEHIDRLKTKLG